MPQQLLGFACVCIALSFGLWHRQKWAWYAGWAVFLLFAIQIARLGALVFSTDQTTHAKVLGFTAVAGIALFWTPIAIWWAKRRKEFGKRHAQPVPQHDTKKPDV